VERKERARELYIKRGELEGGFEIWWEERQKERQRVCETLKERRREGRKMKKIGERWTEWQVQEEGAYRQAQAQEVETYIDDDYKYNDDY
jgi:hypothetical protein